MKRKKFPIVARQRWQGLEIAIENEKGSIRSGKKPDGTMWHTKMLHPYGEITDTEGADGDPVDVFVGPHLASAKSVYVVHQRKVGDWKAYDEDKCMLGFLSLEEARRAFLANYDDPRFLGPITTMTVPEFVRKVKRSDGQMLKALVVFLRPRS